MFDNIERFTNLFKNLTLEYRDLTGKSCLITGGSEGIGYHTALHLAKMGCRVTIASRSEQKCKEAVESIKELSNNNQVDYETVDLGSFQSVREFAEKFTKKNKNSALDFTILNAGATFKSYAETTDSLERTIQINHLSHLLLTLLLLPTIKKAENARIIFLTSDLHLNTTLTLPQDLHINRETFGLNAYFKSKLMNVLTVKKLVRKLADTNITVCSVHPGLVRTQLAHKDQGNSWVRFLIGKIGLVIQMLLARTPDQGALTTVYAVNSDSIVKGEYYDSCKIAKSNPQAEDIKLADELWEQSLAIINVKESDIF